MKKEKVVWGRNLPDIDFGTERSYSDIMDSYKFPEITFKDALSFMYKAAPEKVKNAFLKYGFHIKNQSDLNLLSKLNFNGDDKRLWNIDYKKVLNEITLTIDEMESAHHQIIFSVK